MNDAPHYVPLTGKARLARLVRLARKELAETLRDRRTILTMVLMPLLLYPLLGLVLRQFPPGILTTLAVPAYRLGFRNEAETSRFFVYVREGEALLLADDVFVRPAEGQAEVESAPAVALPLPRLEIVLGEYAEQEVTRGIVDVFLLPRPDTPPAAPEWDLLYLEDSPQGRDAVRHVLRLCEAANWRVVQRQLATLHERMPHLVWQGRPAVAVKPLMVPPEGGRRPSSFLVLVPLILILMTITGAVYPAIDLTAGERERGTLEILMAAPVPRLSLLLAKYVAVVTVALLTALVNLGSMALTLWLSRLGPRLFGLEGLSPLLLLEIFLLLLLFAAFFAAVLLALTSFARSFKEAQAYLIPLMLLALVPGVLSLVPDLPLAGPLVLVPLLNIVLLARDLLLGKAEALPALLVVASTMVYALAAVAVAAAIFGAQAVGSRAGHWFGRRHKPESA
jgi:ABC-2 type transport system permease protein/sodium transport system permease protein